MNIFQKIRLRAARAMMPKHTLRPEMSRVTGGRQGYPLRRWRQEFNLDDHSLAYATEAVVWAYACMEQRAQAVSRMPWHIIDTRTKEQVKDTAFHRAVDYSYHRWQVNLMYNHEMALTIWGENYEEKLQLGHTGIPGGLRWLNPLDMEPYIDGGELLWYEYQSARGEIIEFQPDEIGYHKKTRPSDDNRGLSPIALAMDAVNVDRNITRFIEAFYRNDAAPGGILTARQGHTLNKEDEERIVRQWKEQVKGVDDAFATILLPAALEYHPLTSGPPEHQDLLEESVRRKICAALRVPMSLVNAGGVSDALSASSTMDAQKSAFYENFVIPECEDIQAYYNSTILPWLDPSHTLEFQFDFAAVRSLIKQTREYSDMILNQWNSGTITLNEARREQGYTEVPNGDVLMVPQGRAAVPINEMDRIAELTAMPATPASPEMPRIVFNPPAQLPAATRQADDKPSEDRIEMKSAHDELAAWERYELRRIGKAQRRPFETHVITDQMVDEVRDELANAEDADAVRDVFAAARKAIDTGRSVWAIRSARIDEEAIANVILRMQELGMTQHLDQLSVMIDEDIPHKPDEGDSNELSS